MGEVWQMSSKPSSFTFYFQIYQQLENVIRVVCGMFHIVVVFNFLCVGSLLLMRSMFVVVVVIFVDVASVSDVVVMVVVAAVLMLFFCLLS